MVAKRPSFSVKTLRIDLPVLDPSDVDGLLDLVTDVEGVVAAMVDLEAARIEVVVASGAALLLVKEEVTQALYAGWRALPAR